MNDKLLENKNFKTQCTKITGVTAEEIDDYMSTLNDVYQKINGATMFICGCKERIMPIIKKAKELSEESVRDLYHEAKRNEEKAKKIQDAEDAKTETQAFTDAISYEESLVQQEENKMRNDESPKLIDIKAVNFTGSWQLMEMVNSDDYLKDEGYWWIQRKLAKAVWNENQYIKQDETEISIQIDWGLQSSGLDSYHRGYSYVAPLDGSQINYQYYSNDQNHHILSRTTFNEDKTRIIEQKIKGGKRYTEYRYMDGGWMNVKIENEKGKCMVLVFKKI